MNKFYNIGGLVIGLFCDEPVESTALFAGFETEPAAPDIAVRVIPGPLPETENGVYTTYPKRGEAHRYACRIKTGPHAYDLFVENDNGLWDYSLFYALDFANLLPEHGRATCHCSYVLYRGEAVLFAGNKQIGKSTQASLWQEHAGATIVNGDRAVLAMQNGRLMACGTPYCGSSHIALNISAPVRAIVLLGRGDNRIEAMTDKKARLFALLPHLNYHETRLDDILGIAQQFCSAVPFYQFNCRPDRDAVTVMENELWKQKKDET